MGLGVRVFFIEDDNSLKRISLKRLEKLIDNDADAEPLLGYAGQRVRYALVILDVENRKPIAIRGMDCSILKFDNKGRVDQDEWNKQKYFAVEMMASIIPEPKIESVINARQRFIKKQYEHEFRWELDSEIKKAIAEAIFGSKQSTLRLV